MKMENKNSLLDNLYKVLKEMNFQPRHIVDVGANHGKWTRKALSHFPSSYFTLFEPQEQMRHSISDLLEKNRKIKFNPLGVGKKQGSFLFTIADRDDSCSFRYSEQEAENHGFQQKRIEVVTLNDYFQNDSLPTPDLIKIDAEGLDLEVLEGASNFLGKTEIFMVEASIANLSFDNTLSKVINYMDKRGYKIFDFTDMNRPFQSKILWLVEIVFIKKDGMISKKIADFKI